MDVPYGHRIRIIKKVNEITTPLEEPKHNQYEVLEHMPEEEIDDARERMLFQKAVEEFRKGAQVNMTDEEEDKSTLAVTLPI